MELEDNRIERNAVGVGHFRGNRAQVTKNLFYEQSEGAGLCTETAAPRWEKNRIENNGRGIICRDQSRPLILKNRFIDNRICGIDRSAIARPVIEDNDFLQNKSTWIQDEPTADGNNVA